MSTSTTTQTTTETTTTFVTGVQYGFFFDASRCNGCHACAVACKNWMMLPPGPLKPLKVHEWETGSFPNVQLHFLSMHCFHCAVPACIPKAQGALMKEPKYGAVLLNPNLATSEALRDAADACPYGSITFASDAYGAQAVKCDMCVGRLQQGLEPVCVMACAERALDFDTLPNLQKRYGTLAQIETLPSPSTTTPSVVFKAPDTPQQFVPYDANTALQLLANRGSFPPVYSSPSDVTDTSGVVVGRPQLILKPNGVNDPQDTSVHDEG